MKELFNSYKGFDNFIKMQLLVIFVISFSWALIFPIVAKLQGLLWATSIISAYMIVHKLSTFIMPYFKNTSLKQSYKWLIILDILYLLFIPTYFIDPLLFLYSEAALMVVYGVVLSIFGISYDAYLMETYNTRIFKDVQYVERLFMAVAGIVGYSIVIFIDVISSSIEVSLYTFMCILAINVLFQLYNYKYFWNNLKEK